MPFQTTGWHTGKLIALDKHFFLDAGDLARGRSELCWGRIGKDNG